MGSCMDAGAATNAANEEVLGTSNAVADSTTALEDAKLLVENTKEISREAFVLGIQKLLNLTIAGYPRAIRSSLSKRNELLRRFDGDQDAAVEEIKRQAASITEEAKTWVLGLVPYVGLPGAILYPTWRLLRRVCVMAGLYGHDLDLPETRAKIVHVFGGLRAVPAVEYAIETAVQLVWTSFVGPVAAFVPVGTLVSKVANVEGKVMGIVGQETFSEGRQLVPEEVYMQVLDGEPTPHDFAALAKDGAEYTLLRAWALGGEAVAVCVDDRRRSAAVCAAISTSSKAATQATAVGATIVKAAPGVAKEAIEATPAAAEKAAKTARASLEKGFDFGKSLLAGGKK
mmetsp:Transcript_143793/g.358424  ORF Transcript_143793/g.358424 Transcript_143793/m.358424 type:complete len:343 (-) Transcript_143793:39-1067(-)